MVASSQDRAGRSSTKWICAGLLVCVHGAMQAQDADNLAK